MCLSYLFMEKWTTCSHVQSCNWCSFCFNSSFSQFSEQIVNSKQENVIPEDLLIWYAVPAFSVVRFLSPARKVSCWMLIYAKAIQIGVKIIMNLHGTTLLKAKYTEPHTGMGRFGCCVMPGYMNSRTCPENNSCYKFEIWFLNDFGPMATPRDFLTVHSIVSVHYPTCVVCTKAWKLHQLRLCTCTQVVSFSMKKYATHTV